MNEIFVPIKNFEGRYLISNTGKVVSINGRHKGERILPTVIDKFGYRSTTLRKKPLKRCVRIHTLVAEAFIEKPKENYVVNHKDGNKLNNCISNLEWVSAAENCKHAVATGLLNLKGEKHPQSKLTNEKVRQIRLMAQQGLTHQAISDKVGISRRHITDIINRICWGWLD